MTDTENTPDSSSTDTPTEDLEQRFSEIYYESFKDNKKIQQGLTNLQSLPDFDSGFAPVKGKDFTPGVIGFRKFRSDLTLAIACGTAQVRFLDLAKFVALIENMHDQKSATIMLQNFTDHDDSKGSKGQILARFNPECSAIHIIQGLTGRIIRNPSDIALFDVYYLNRVDLTSYYLAAKAQLSNADLLETMVATYEGWKAYNVPLNPLNPYEERE